jgi:hypothetical protein
MSEPPPAPRAGLLVQLALHVPVDFVHRNAILDGVSSGIYAPKQY